MVIKTLRPFFVFNKKYKTIIGIDIVTFFLLFLLFSGTALILEKKVLPSFSNLPASNAEELASLPAEELQELSSTLKVAFVILFFTLLITIALTFIGYTYSTLYVWNLLQKQKTSFASWCWFHTTLLLLSPIILLVTLLLQIISNFFIIGIIELLFSNTRWMYSGSLEIVEQLIGTLIGFSVLLLFLFVLFSWYDLFSSTGKIWNSIALGLQKLYVAKKKLFAFLPMVLLLSLLLASTLYLAKQYITLFVAQCIGFFISVYLFSWIRHAYIIIIHESAKK